REEHDEVERSPLFFQRRSHHVEEQQRDEERERFHHAVARLRELPRREAPPFAGLHRVPAEGEEARVLFAVLVLEQKKRDVQETENEHASEVFTARPEHDLQSRNLLLSDNILRAGELKPIAILQTVLLSHATR